MKIDILHSFKSRLVLLILIALSIITISILPGGFNKWLDNILLDIQFKIRGPRQLSDEIIFIFIGQEDINQLGNWPITRDYYAYLTHKLKAVGAKAIGFDILFQSPDREYPEYDQMLSAFFQEAGNVCLPMTFERIFRISQNSQKAYSGEHPAFPFALLQKAVAGIGFSNFQSEAIIREVPLMATQQDCTFLSFGVELARLYLNESKPPRIEPDRIQIIDQSGNFVNIPLSNNGNIKLNHFGTIHDLNSMSIVDLLKSNEFDKQVLDKLIIVGVTKPGISILKATPLSPVLPATLIHATVAENIIKQNYLRNVSIFFQWLILLIFALLPLGIWKISHHRLRILLIVSMPIFYWIIASILFSQKYLIMPLFYPTLLFIIANIPLYLVDRKENLLKHTSMRYLLQDQVRQKATELKDAKNKLKEYQHLLVDKDRHSEELLRLAGEREKSILKLETELRDLHAYLIPERPHSLEEFDDIIYSQDSKLREVLDLVDRIRSDDIPVLIIGETGSGKELIARAIHKTSLRREKQFIAINCGALTETLLESELFGHEKGSFTGAYTRRRGRFEMANGGTIFLDEISETSAAFQAKLLRVLQEGSFERVGGEQAIQVNVRIIAASNQDLSTAIEKGEFRSDLFYRLNGFPIKIPSLKERVNDIPFLSHHFLQKYEHSLVQNISDQAMTVLKSHKWPGNIRELENTIRRAAIIARSENRDMIRLTDLPEEIWKEKTSDTVNQIYQPFEIQMLEILRSFKFSHAAISQTAKVLGNKDRGTITEHLRGICFKEVIQANFDFYATAKKMSSSDDKETNQRVEKKIKGYINNLYPLPDLSGLDQSEISLLSQFKGLPQKYHPFLIQLICHLQSKKA
jgi:transcriptional regulator with GAF, ATPase, and Fis domain/CHASE2 domain-containing sensor protein